MGSDPDKELLDAIYAGVSLNKLDAVPKDSTNWFKATENGEVYEFVIVAEAIKQAFIDAGYSKSPLASIKAKMEISGMMTGREWLSKALHTFYDYQNERDYFRNDEQFRASTVTMAEVEALLKKAAGIE